MGRFVSVEKQVKIVSMLRDDEGRKYFDFETMATKKEELEKLHEK